MNMTSRTAILLASAVLLAPAASAAERAERTFDLDEALPAGAAVRVENLLGSMTIVGGGPAGRVKIEAQVVAEAKTKEDADALVALVSIGRLPEAGPAAWRVAWPLDRSREYRLPPSEAKGPLQRWLMPLVKRDKTNVSWGGTTVVVGPSREAVAMAVNLKVTIPNNAEVSALQVVGAAAVMRVRGKSSVETMDGGISADQAYGTLQIRGGAGDVDIRTFHGDALDAETLSGEITMADARGKQGRVKSVSGALRLTDLVGGAWSLETTSGEIALDHPEPSKLAVSSASGDIVVDSSLKTMRDVTLKTASGNVEIRVDQAAPFTCEAHTESGDAVAKGIDRLKSDGGGKLTTWRRGTGGATIRVETASGSIKLARAR